MFLVPSTTRKPFGSSRATRAVRLVVRAVVRDVEPEPLSSISFAVLARFASAPLEDVNPARAVMELFTLDLRDVCVAPVDTAEACSATMMVTTSSTWLAFRSRARSPIVDEISHVEPGVLPDSSVVDRLSASRTYSSSAVGFGGFGLWEKMAPKLRLASRKSNASFTGSPDRFVSTLPLARPPARGTSCRNRDFSTKWRRRDGPRLPPRHGRSTPPVRYGPSLRPDHPWLSPRESRETPSRPARPRGLSGAGCNPRPFRLPTA